MKKILPFLLTIALIFALSACKKENLKPQLCGISFTADMTYYNEVYKGECEIDEKGGIKLRLTEPEILSGYTVFVDGEGVRAEYLGISFTPPENSLPFSSVAKDFYKAVEKTLTGELAAEKSGEEYKISGGSGAESYTLYISPSGLPQKLLIPDERFSVYFYNVAVASRSSF